MGTFKSMPFGQTLWYSEGGWDDSSASVLTPTGTQSSFSAQRYYLRDEGNSPDGVWWAKSTWASGDGSFLTILARIVGSAQIGAWVFPTGNGEAGALRIFQGDNQTLLNVERFADGHGTIPSTYWVRFEAQGLNLSVSVYAADRATLFAGPYTVAAPQGTPVSNGNVGVGHYGARPVLGFGYEAASTGPAFADGSLSVSGVTQTGATLSGTAPTGGTTPYAYEWRRSDSATVLSNAQSLGAASGLSPSTAYTYTRKASDAAGATHTSSVSFTTSAPAGVGDLTVLALGDSITATSAMYLDQMGAVLRALGKARNVTIVDKGVGGTNSRDWAVGGSLATDAIATATQLQPTDITIALGTNNTRGDGDRFVSQADTQAYTLALVDALRAASPSSKITLFATPTPAFPVTDGGYWDSTDGVHGYNHTPKVNAAMKAVADQRGLVFEGTAVFDRIGQEHGLLANGEYVHPTPGSLLSTMLGGVRAVAVGRSEGIGGGGAPVADFVGL